MFIFSKLFVEKKRWRERISIPTLPSTHSNLNDFSDTLSNESEDTKEQSISKSEETKSLLSTAIEAGSRESCRKDFDNPPFSKKKHKSEDVVSQYKDEQTKSPLSMVIKASFRESSPFPFGLPLVVLETKEQKSENVVLGSEETMLLPSIAIKAELRESWLKGCNDPFYSVLERKEQSKNVVSTYEEMESPLSSAIGAKGLGNPPQFCQ